MLNQAPSVATVFSFPVFPSASSTGEVYLTSSDLAYISMLSTELGLNVLSPEEVVEMADTIARWRDEWDKDCFFEVIREIKSGDGDLEEVRVPECARARG